MVQKDQEVNQSFSSTLQIQQYAQGRIGVPYMLHSLSSNPYKLSFNLSPSGEQGPAGPPGLRGSAGPPGDAGIPGKPSLISPS